MVQEAILPWISSMPRETKIWCVGIKYRDLLDCVFLHSGYSQFLISNTSVHIQLFSQKGLSAAETPLLLVLRAPSSLLLALLLGGYFFGAQDILLTPYCESARGKVN